MIIVFAIAIAIFLFIIFKNIRTKIKVNLLFVDPLVAYVEDAAARRGAHTHQVRQRGRCYSQVLIHLSTLGHKLPCYV